MNGTSSCNYLDNSVNNRGRTVTVGARNISIMPRARQLHLVACVDGRKHDSTIHFQGLRLGRVLAG